MMPPVFKLHGYAIVSADDCLSDALGNFPDALKNDADWAYFQAGMDRAAVTLLGGRSHRVSPNPGNRLRLVMSRQVAGLERRADGVWWNPAGMPLAQALALIAPQGGQVAVAGGQEVYDRIGAAQFDAFHLARNHPCALPGGAKIFAACDKGASAEAVLKAGGMQAGPLTWLDEAAQVSLCVWKNPAAV